MPVVTGGTLVAESVLATDGPLAFCPRNPKVVLCWQATNGPLVA